MALTCMIYFCSVINEVKLMIVLVVFLDMNIESVDTLYCTSYPVICPFGRDGGFHDTVKVSGSTPTLDTVRDDGGPETT